MRSLASAICCNPTLSARLASPPSPPCRQLASANGCQECSVSQILRTPCRQLLLLLLLISLHLPDLHSLPALHHSSQPRLQPAAARGVRTWR